MTDSSHMPGKIHQGRNIKRFREMLGIKQESLAHDLGEDWSQKKVSLLEQKETIEEDILRQVSDILHIPVEAIQNFDEEQAVNIISNTFNKEAFISNSGAIFNIDPVEKLIQLHEELQKLQLIAPAGSTISPEMIEENIGISKDFNNFELRKAIGKRDEVKAHQIINYFSQNPKDNPMLVTISSLFSFFSQLLQYHGLADKSKGNLAKHLKVHPYFVEDYVVAGSKYPMKKVSNIIGYLREADVKGKGVRAAGISPGDLLKELMVKIMR